MQYKALNYIGSYLFYIITSEAWTFLSNGVINTRHFSHQMRRAMEEDFKHQIDHWKNMIADEKNNLEDEMLICECFCVSVGDIRNRFKNKNDFDLEIIKSERGFSSGCTSCLKQLDTQLDKIFNC